MRMEGGGAVSGGAEQAGQNVCGSESALPVAVLHRVLFAD